MTILQIDSAITGENSISRAVTAAITAELARNGGTVIRRDLTADPLPHLTLDQLGANGDGRAVLAEFHAADTVVIGAPVEAAISQGQDVLFDVDWQGGQQIRNSTLRDAVVSIFILPPSIAELEKRLRARGQDPDAVVAERMAKSRDEISHWAEYDYVLINESLPQCEAELRAIIAAERLRRDRRPELVGTVRRLSREFEERLR